MNVTPKQFASSFSSFLHLTIYDSFFSYKNVSLFLCLKFIIAMCADDNFWCAAFFMLHLQSNRKNAIWLWILMMLPRCRWRCRRCCFGCCKNNRIEKGETERTNEQQQKKNNNVKTSVDTVDCTNSHIVATFSSNSPEIALSFAKLTRSSCPVT